MSDSLREEVKREMEQYSCRIVGLHDEVLPKQQAVEVAVRMIEKWGHVKRCGCHGTPCGVAPRHGHPWYDPRCAPQKEPNHGA